jgi:hypothetical protein
MKKLMDRRWFWCLLVLFGAGLGAGGPKVMNYYKALKDAGYPVDADGNITYWLRPSWAPPGSPEDMWVNYTVISVPTEEGKPPKRLVLQIGDVFSRAPDETGWSGLVISAPKDDGSQRSAGTAKATEHPQVETLGHDGFVAKYGKVKLKNGWMIEASKAEVTPADKEIAPPESLDPLLDPASTGVQGPVQGLQHVHVGVVEYQRSYYNTRTPKQKPKPTINTNYK